MADDSGDFWSGVFVAGLLFGAIYYCSQKDAKSKIDAQPEQFATDAAETPKTDNPPTPPPPPAPKPYYSERDGSTYYYVSAVSEEDQKKGRASGDVIGYQYGGRDASGAHIIRSGGYTYTCSEPCKIIKVSDGDRIAYNEESMIGAVFRDASFGFLQAPKKPKVKTAVKKSENVAADGWQYDPAVSDAPEEAATE